MAGWVVLGTVGSVAAGVAVFVFWVWLRMRSYRADAAVGGDMTPEISLARYQPMARLLGESDLDFLRHRRKCSPRAIKSWRRERKRIVRMYLRDLSADFNRLHRQARELVAISPEEYSGLVILLLRHQLVFWRAMAMIEVNLVMEGFGLGHADARRLLQAFDVLRLEVARHAAPVGL